MALSEGDTILIKGELPGFTGGTEFAQSVLQSLGVNVAGKLTASVGAIITSNDWINASGANRSWFKKAVDKGVRVIYDYDLASIIEGGTSLSSSSSAAPSSTVGSASADRPRAEHLDGLNYVSVGLPGSAPESSSSSVGSCVPGFVPPRKKAKKASASSSSSSSSSGSSSSAAAAAAAAADYTADSSSSSSSSSSSAAAAGGVGAPSAKVLADSHWSDWSAYGGGIKPYPLPGERRQAGHWRAQPPHDLLDRIHRAANQRMYLLDKQPLPYSTPGTSFVYSVLGSTGNMYRVTISHRPSCNCPDSLRGHRCKHVVFVLLKFLKVPSNHPLLWQASYMTHELQYIFDHAPDPVRSAALADARTRQLYATTTGAVLFDSHTVSSSGDGSSGGGDGSNSSSSSGSSAAATISITADRKQPTDEDECPICMEVMGTSLTGLSYCKGCKNNFHLVCINEWSKAKKSSGATVTCPYCRSPWSNPLAAAVPPSSSSSSAAAGGGSSSSSSSSSYSAAAVGGASISRNGYLNFGASANLSSWRDTSTYYSGPRKGEKRPYGGNWDRY